MMPAPFDGVKSVNAHRFSWLIHKGRIPDGQLVLHKCDNPTCVRPAHLFLGSTYDNMRDRDRKGRQAWGERHSRAKMSDKKARLLLSLKPRGKTPWGFRRDTAKTHGVSEQILSLLWARKIWRHL